MTTTAGQGVVGPSSVNSLTELAEVEHSLIIASQKTEHAHTLSHHISKGGFGVSTKVMLVAYLE